MKDLYRILLRLYPVAYQKLFAEEMMCVFNQANSRVQPRRLFFALREINGLLKGACAEHMTKMTKQNDYLADRNLAPDVPDTIARARHEVQEAIRAMQHAIAHHDFPQARFYSDQERAARARLDRLTSGAESPLEA